MEIKQKMEIPSGICMSAACLGEKPILAVMVRENVNKAPVWIIRSNFNSNMSHSNGSYGSSFKWLASNCLEAVPV